MGSFCSGDTNEQQTEASRARKPNAKPVNAPSETEDSVTYDASVTVDSAVLSAAKSESFNNTRNKPNNNNNNNNNRNNNNNNSNTNSQLNANSFKIMVTPPNEADDADFDGPSQEQYNKIKDDLRKKRDEAENLVEWKKVADFAAILPKEAKEKLWKGVFKTQEDETMPENKRISKVLRTFVMLHLTRQYKREKKDVPDEVRAKLPAMTKNPSRFIGDFIKQSSSKHEEMFLSIYNELKTLLECDKKLKQEKLDKKLKLLKTNYDELTRQPIGPTFNDVDFLKQAYLQYILYAYQRRMDEVN